MNVKKAKALRKELNYKPSGMRSFDTLTLYTTLGRVRSVPSTRINHVDSPRAKYQAAKAELKAK